LTAAPEVPERIFSACQPIHWAGSSRIEREASASTITSVPNSS
jgi:hypothetical protein